MASRNRTLSFLVILSALMAFTSLSTDIYLPALPVMERTLGGDAELTVTGFLIGFAIAQLVWGPVSDRIGRKLPLFLGMVLFVIGSVGCALSQSMAAVVFWRVFQALGACANAAALASVEKTVGGAAAALIGALQYGSGIVSSLLLAAFSDGTPRAMTGLIALFVGLSALMAMGGRRVVV
jgi:proP protein